MLELIVVLAEWLELIVMLFVSLTAVVDRVMPAAVALLLLSTRLPVPLTPPERSEERRVGKEGRFGRSLYTDNEKMTVSAEDVQFSVITVTVDPTATTMVVEPTA